MPIYPVVGRTGRMVMIDRRAEEVQVLEVVAPAKLL